MSRLSARFFSFVQGAAFYRELHRQAVLLLPPGDGARWMDVGCGPGLVTRLAADRGYHASGFDIDPEMVKQARRLAQRDDCAAQFEEATLNKLVASRFKADVVSATSLLAVLDEREAAVLALLACLKSEGVLVIIETTEAMKPSAAKHWLKQNGYHERNWILLLWAWARSKGRTIKQSDLDVAGYCVDRVELLNGLVAAWIIRRNGAPPLLGLNDGAQN